MSVRAWLISNVCVTGISYLLSIHVMDEILYELPMIVLEQIYVRIISAAVISQNDANLTRQTANRWHHSRYDMLDKGGDCFQ